MRVAATVTTVIVFGLFLYAVVSFTAVSVAINTPQKAAPAAEPLPLEKAAPEIDKLRGAFRDLAATAFEAIALCPNRHEESEPARPRGKVLVWDVERNDVSEAHGRLPAELRLQSPSDNCTVYLITDRERRAVMNYNHDIFHGGGSTGVQGFRTDLIVCAVDLPSQQPRGRYRINGNGPPQIIELKKGMKEVDEDWAGNLQRWIDACVHGPPARYYNPPQQKEARCADEARRVIDQCEMLGSLPVLGNLPTEASVWNPQTDRWHPGHGGLFYSADGDKPFLMVMVLDDQFVRDRTTGHFDYRVALVSFPGPQPLGVYLVRGEDWLLPRKPGESWGPADSHGRDPSRALSSWVNHFLRKQRGMPPGTMLVAPDATQLAGTDWLIGPGWLKRLKAVELPADQKGWEQMAEQCSAAVASCRAKGSPGAVGKLPQKIVAWTDHSECFFPSPVQKELPKAMQAAPKDRDVLMALVVSSTYEQEPKEAPRIERSIYEIALFTMPGARPVGMYRIVGAPINANWRAQNGGNGPDPGKDISDWLKRFVESPQTVAKLSALR